MCAPRRAARRQYGLLEKKKDYKLRADDFHKKEEALRRLRRKAEERNPDEFYFAMQGAQTRQGVHTKRCAAVTLCAPLWMPAKPAASLHAAYEHVPRHLQSASLCFGAAQLDGGKQVLTGGAAAYEDAGHTLRQPEGAGGGQGARASYLLRFHRALHILLSKLPEATWRCRKWSGCGARCTSLARRRRRGTLCLWTARQRPRPSRPRSSLTRTRSWSGACSTGRAGACLPCAACSTLEGISAAWQPCMTLSTTAWSVEATEVT